MPTDEPTPAPLAAPVRPDDCKRGAECGGSLLTVAGQRYVGCGLAGCKHNWCIRLGGCGEETGSAR